ncbi:hypothetical protein ACMG4P_17005 [Pseudovibrio denitrificans]|uniref:hypothetical protein n=1 Tax=Pseudovibrio denitrificans TaxID=258256 RepID=UPI0039BEE5AE
MPRLNVTILNASKDQKGYTLDPQIPDSTAEIGEFDPEDIERLDAVDLENGENALLTFYNNNQVYASCTLGFNNQGALFGQRHPPAARLKIALQNNGVLVTIL